MGLTKIDKAVASVKFIIRKRRDVVDRISKKMQMSEREKIFVGEELDWIQNVELLLSYHNKELQRNLGKIPPQALDLEEVVLGAMILEPVCIPAVMPVLHEQHFYKEEHRVMFMAIKGLVLENKPIDMRTVVFQLRKNGTLEAAGGAYYVAQLTSKLSSAANIMHHAACMIEQAMRRKLIEVGNMTHDAYDDTKDVFDILDETEKELELVRSWLDEKKFSGQLHTVR